MDPRVKEEPMSAPSTTSVTGRARNGALTRSAHDFALLEEFSFVRREAQAEANLAYEDWRCLRSGEAYAVYRAAQDRADAAQDDLARATELIAA
jgi:hypothetical protein